MDMPVTDDQNKCTSESTAGESQEKRGDYWRLKIESLQELIRAKDQTIRILEEEKGFLIQDHSSDELARLSRKN